MATYEALPTPFWPQAEQRTFSLRMRLTGARVLSGAVEPVSYAAIVEDRLDALLFWERQASAGNHILFRTFNREDAKLEEAIYNYLGNSKEPCARADFQAAIVYFLGRDVNIFQKIRNNNLLHDRPAVVEPSSVIAAHQLTLEAAEALDVNRVVLSSYDLQGEYNFARQQYGQVDNPTRSLGFQMLRVGLVES